MKTPRDGYRAAAFGLGAWVLLATPACGDDDESRGEGGGGAGSSTSSTSSATTAATTTGATTSSGDGGSTTSGSSTGGGGEGGSGGGGGSGSGGGGGEPAVWAAPACDVVAGTASLTFSTDEGDTLTPRRAALGGISYSTGLAALDTPNVLLLASDGLLLRSADAGCSFAELGPLSAAFPRIVAATGGVAYVFGENELALLRVEGETVTPLTAPGVEGADGIVGLGADPLDPDHVRLGLFDGTLWDSTDGGETFSQVGVAPPDGCFYQVAFDPTDLDRALCATFDTGTWWTEDGGSTWERSKTDVLYSNAFRVAISPVDPQVVWVEGLENDLHQGEPVGTLIRHIWRSTDGGVTFATIIDETAEAGGDGGEPHLYNGNVLAPHPTDPAVLYYAFGWPPIQGTNYTELFRLDADAGTFTVERQEGGDIDDYGAITFNPGAEDVVYLALSSERGG